MKQNSNTMRLEINNEHDMAGADIARGTLCAVCGKPIEGPPALWITVNPTDFFLHKNCEPGFSQEIVKRALGDFVLVMQDESLHDVPPERN